MSTINIAFVSDDNYFKHMAVAIKSIVMHSKSCKFAIYILDVGISNANKKKLLDEFKYRTNIKIEFLSINAQKLNKYSIKSHVSLSAYAKIYLCEVISVNYIIYLDCDLIINNDLELLWNQFEQNVSLKAVWNPFYSYDNEYIGVQEGIKTFNSGVMLLNLQAMREMKASVKLENFLNEFNELTKLHDQAAFNAVFKDQWKELDIEWNCQVSMLQNSIKDTGLSKNKYINLYKDANIIHFTSNSKPWMFRNIHPYKKLYIQLHKEVFGKFEYKDKSIKSLMQKLREYSKYRYYYYVNINKREIV